MLVKFNSGGDKITFENRNCKHGEINMITNDIYCNFYNEFCKFVCECPLKLPK